jgi:microcystin-dependent protein
MPITINNKTGVISGITTVTSSTTASQFPTGVVQMYGGSTAPTGWILCNGTAVSRTTYASLFAVCSTAFGTGDGSTTFNVPDFRGRTPIGVGTGSGLTARTLGSNYGAETSTLSSSNIPSLTTGNISADHTHTPQIAGTTLSNGQQGFVALGGGYQGFLTINYGDGGAIGTTSSSSANHTHTYTNASPTATAILSPCLGINYIIKT